MSLITSPKRKKERKKKKKTGQDSEAQKKT
jgi:hypothetical protein